MFIFLHNLLFFFSFYSLDKLGTGMPSEELGHIIFTSIRGDLLHQENLFILLRVLWLKATIFLCQGDTDIVIETLELVRNLINVHKTYMDIINFSIT